MQQIVASEGDGPYISTDESGGFTDCLGNFGQRHLEPGQAIPVLEKALQDLKA